MNRKLSFLNCFLLAIAFFLTSTTMANVKLPYVLSSNMVLQRDAKTAIWGWADPGEKITVEFRNESVNTKATNDGHWLVKIQPGDAGGPFEMKIKGKDELRLENILVGDVWVCSGQSNMEWPLVNANGGSEEVKNANYPNIRLFQVENNASPVPVDNTAAAKWEVCNAETVPGFSAIAYYFGKKIHLETGVPIGLISSNWGGTIVETWISEQTVNNDPFMANWLKGLKNLDLDELAKSQAVIFENYQKKLKEVQDANYTNANLYVDYDDSNWMIMAQPQLWENIPEMDGFNGIVWFRKTIMVPQGFDLNKATLALARIDDTDITWINGKRVGGVYNKYNLDRKYEVPAGVLTIGNNQLTVRVEDYQGGGGIYGAANDMYLSDGQTTIDLSGDWTIRKDKTETPKNPYSLSNNTLMPNEFPSLLFNGMIHPLLNYAIKGAIWYQGESNADGFQQASRYENQLRLMIADWRKQWGRPNFPFYMVQLANFKPETTVPQNEIWAYVREAQANVASDANVGMACIIDIGEAGDIHPKNKVDVGDRLALNALKYDYGIDVIARGPIMKEVKFEGNKAIVTFDLQGSKLKVTNKYGYINGFAVAGSDKVFHYAQALLIANNQVEVKCSEVENIAAVRFLWADNPGEINLYNSTGLPAEPFRTDSW